MRDENDCRGMQAVDKILLSVSVEKVEGLNFLGRSHALKLFFFENLKSNHFQQTCPLVIETS